MEVIRNKWVIFKWISMVLNVLIELCQAILTQENGNSKISTHSYLTISLVTSCCCLMISLIEIIREWKESKVVWEQRSFYWQGRLKGKFSVYFGISTSTLQFVINLVAIVRKNNVVRFDILPLLLSFGYLIAATANPGEEITVICRILRSFPFLSVSIERVSVSQGAAEFAVPRLRPKVVSLKSSDGEIFEVDGAVVMQSQLIQHMIEQGLTDNDIIIPLPGISTHTLSKVVEYMIEKQAQDELEETNGSYWFMYTCVASERYVKSLKLDELFDRILAAKYLEVRSLLNSTCAAAAKMLGNAISLEEKEERGDKPLVDQHSRHLAQQLVRRWFKKQQTLKKLRAHVLVIRTVNRMRASLKLQEPRISDKLE